MEYVKRAALDCFTVVACTKRGALGACFAVGYEKQAAFRGCHEVGGEKRGSLDCFTVMACINRAAFSCPRVGAYCIRPTGDPFMGRMIRMIDRRCAFLSPAGPFCGAYAIRPYPDGRKMIAVGACFEVEYEKQAAFWGCYGVGYAKRGAMPASYCLAWRRSYACDLLL